MTLTIELPETEEAAWNAEAARLGVTPEGLSEQAAMQALIAGLKDPRILQSLDEIKPRRLPPPGKTAWERVVEQWPRDEADEELQAALKAAGWKCRKTSLTCAWD